MTYKYKALIELVYKNFIKGVYGAAHIPTKDEVLTKISSITPDENIPITKYEKMDDISLTQISKTFDNIIDDLDIIYSSIENESEDILDQLTHSLKEYNGIKRELKKIDSLNEDISSRKFGTEYLNYQFSESFNDLKNIDLARSYPVDIDAGVFTIQTDTGNILSLEHYRGHKLEFNVVEYYSKLLDYGYVGGTNAEAILDPADPRYLIYRIKTSGPTKLKVVTSFQLTPDEKLIEINGIGILVDSTHSKGSIRVYYRDGYKWKDIPTLSIQEIKNDKLIFKFETVKATHIKLEFIKDGPDNLNTNEFFISIQSISITKGNTKRVASLYSKPIEAENYNNEVPIINTISAQLDAFVPPECGLRLWVASDLKVSGAFLDINDNQTELSINAVKFDPFYSSSVYLSDLIEASPSISGVELYNGVDYNWKELKTEFSQDKLPEIIELKNIQAKSKLDNSLFKLVSMYTYGDNDYVGPWPQEGSLENYYISGWCNSSNSAWTYLEPLVASYALNEGIDVATKLGIPWELIEISGILNSGILADENYSGQWLGYATGYPLNYTVPVLNRVFRYNEYDSVIDGWWRPYSHAVEPLGINSKYSDGFGNLDEPYINSLPDFHFNSLDFYKIYKFGNISSVIENSIKLYSYQEMPVYGDGVHKPSYPHQFIWKYRDTWTVETNTIQKTNNSLSDEYLRIPVVTTKDNETILVNGITDLKLSESNVVFSQGTDYFLIKSDDVVTHIDITGIKVNYEHIPLSGKSAAYFDYSYVYKKENKYESTFIGYAIVSDSISAPQLIIKNYKNNDGLFIVNDVLVESFSNENSSTISKNGNDFKIVFDKTVSGDAHYKITLKCLSDETTGFSAILEGTETVHYIPYQTTDEKFLSVDAGIKIVSNIQPMIMVDFSTLLYNTGGDTDNRFAIYTDAFDEKYIVVKLPSMKNVQGYYFDQVNQRYIKNISVLNQNKGHYLRRGLYNGAIIQYTTGSQNGIVYNNNLAQDTTWNNAMVVDEFPNTIPNVYFPNHSTYDYPIIVERELTHKGFLFYNSGENLSSYFSISYKYLSEKEESDSRFLYKIDLISDTKANLTPIVRSVRFLINK